MTEETRRWIVVLVVVFAVVLLLDPASSCRKHDPDVNERLAQVAQDAVKLAKEAQEEAAASRRSANAWYFVSLVAAVTVPLVIAFFLFRHHGNAPPEPPEILHELRRIVERDRPKLAPPPQQKLLEKPEQAAKGPTPGERRD